MVTSKERREWAGQIRGAIYRGDGAGVLAHLRADPEWLPLWQLVGDGVAVALARRVDGARSLATDCVAALRERGWAGDAELADQLDALAGTGPTPLLRPLAVDLEMLCEIREGDPLTAGGVLDLQTGQVWPRVAMEYADEQGAGDDDLDLDDVERFLHVDGDSRDGYRDMVTFIDTVPDEDRADRLRAAIRGRGAFRRFADTLGRWQEDELSRWFEFADERKRGRARAWLADAGYRVAAR